VTLKSGYETEARSAPVVRGSIAEPDDYCERMGCGQAGLTSEARRIWCLEDREIARLARLSS